MKTSPIIAPWWAYSSRQRFKGGGKGSESASARTHCHGSIDGAESVTLVTPDAVISILDTDLRTLIILFSVAIRHVSTE